MPKIDLSAVPARRGSGYPEPWGSQFDGRIGYALGDHAGLTQFGARLTVLEPGAMSSLRHWHEEQDEFLVMLAGELVLVEDDGETTMRPGDFAAWPKGVANGHHLVNRSGADASFVCIGTRTAADTGWYSEVDLMVRVTGDEARFTRRDGAEFD